MPDWDSTERRDSDEDAAWRDLIARFDAPSESGKSVPWPDREETAPPAPPASASLVQTETSTTGDLPADPAGADTDQTDAAQTDAARTDAPAADAAAADSVAASMASSWRTAARPAADPDDEHFVPPPPPPLPRLEPLTKAAWTALFGGPAYLLVATAAGWSLPGVAVFCAIAAFVGGVALLVLRLNDSGPPSSGDDDNGAVV